MDLVCCGNGSNRRQSILHTKMEDFGDNLLRSLFLRLFLAFVSKSFNV